MCGIAGFISLTHRSSTGDHEARIRRMTDALRHRGPDGEGIWVDRDIPIALGHRRLAIIDTSAAGHQPMISEGGRYVTVFNGEIYNFQLLAMELTKLGHSFRGHSDTEVLLAAIQEWGVEKALKKGNSMLALAVWDRKERVLHLARDRVGKKPLYYGYLQGQLVFASELKALRAVFGEQLEINRDTLTLLLRHNYIPAPYSIYSGIHKLEPGHLLSIEIDKIREGRLHDSLPELARPYWDLQAVAHERSTDPFTGNLDEAADEVERILSDAVRLRMVADVPLGALLSGGVDSSIVTALMQNQCERAVRTFSIGFRESGFNEAHHAKAVAAHLGTEHTELYVSPHDALDVIPKLPQIHNEPFSDSSQIPTYLVSRLTRDQVTVALSGDGGDELFCGYSRFHMFDLFWRIFFVCLPTWARVSLGATVAWASSSDRYRLMNPLFKALKQDLTPAKLLRLRDLLNEVPASRAEMYRQLVSHWKDPQALVLSAKEPATVFDRAHVGFNFPEFKHQMMLLDMMSYLPDDILVKLDRASMAVGLEARCPLLDHRLVEFAWRLPLALKTKASVGKRVLRHVLYRHVPRALVERPKQGFGLPLGAWLRGPLREWAEVLLSTERLRSDGFFDPAPIRHYWDEHQAGRSNLHYYLWDVLMFQAWLDDTRGSGVTDRAASVALSA